MPTGRVLQVAFGAAALTAGALVGLYYWKRRSNKKKPARVIIAITGFGKFNGVGDNPTERFVKAMPFFLKANPLPDHVVVDRCIVLEVSAEACKEELDIMRSTVFQSSDDARVYLHLGVAVKTNTFKLETTAWNEATFRVPDERGWEPASQPIYPDDGKVSAKRRTRLPIGLITRKLQRLNFPVSLSSDPGRFICNYLYYESLRRCCPPPLPDAPAPPPTNPDDYITEHSLFLHVPPTEVIDEARQMAFLHTLLTTIADCLCT